MPIEETRQAANTRNKEELNGHLYGAVVWQPFIKKYNAAGMRTPASTAFPCQERIKIKVDAE